MDKLVQPISWISLASFAIPGALVFWAAAFRVSEAKQMFDAAVAGHAGEAVVCGVLVVLFGFVVDGIRTVVVDWPVGKSLPSANEFMQKRSRQDFEKIVDNVWRWYMAYAHFAIALVVSSLLTGIYPWGLVLALVMAADAWVQLNRYRGYLRV